MFFFSEFIQCIPQETGSALMKHRVLYIFRGPLPRHSHTHKHGLLLLLEPHCPARQNSWRTMRHWSGQRWHCDELLLEAIMGIYIIPWHLASHSTHYQCGMSCLCRVFECSWMHVCVHMELNIFPWHLASLSTWRSAGRGNVGMPILNPATYYFFVCVCLCVHVSVCLCVSVLCNRVRIGIHSY